MLIEKNFFKLIFLFLFVFNSFLSMQKPQTEKSCFLIIIKGTDKKELFLNEKFLPINYNCDSVKKNIAIFFKNREEAEKKISGIFLNGCVLKIQNPDEETLSIKDLVNKNFICFVEIDFFLNKKEYKKKPIEALLNSESSDSEDLEDLDKKKIENKKKLGNFKEEKFSLGGVCKVIPLDEGDSIVINNYKNKKEIDDKDVQISCLKEELRKLKEKEIEEVNKVEKHLKSIESGLIKYLDGAISEKCKTIDDCIFTGEEQQMKFFIEIVASKISTRDIVTLKNIINYKDDLVFLVKEFLKSNFNCGEIYLSHLGIYLGDDDLLRKFLYKVGKKNLIGKIGIKDIEASLRLLFSEYVDVSSNIKIEEFNLLNMIYYFLAE
jgi:hypothetical protein